MVIDKGDRVDICQLSPDERYTVCAEVLKDAPIFFVPEVFKEYTDELNKALYLRDEALSISKAEREYAKVLTRTIQKGYGGVSQGCAYGEVARIMFDDRATNELLNNNLEVLKKHAEGSGYSVPWYMDIVNAIIAACGIDIRTDSCQTVYFS